jgi:hypothetical protein
VLEVDCLQCGSHNPDNASYCKGCGTKLTDQLGSSKSFHLQVLLITVAIVLFFAGVFLVARTDQDELLDLARGAALPDYGPQAAAAIIERYIPDAQWDVTSYPDGYARVYVTGHLNQKSIEIEFMLNISYREMHPTKLIYDRDVYPSGMIHQKLSSMFRNEPIF